MVRWTIDKKNNYRYKINFEFSAIVYKMSTGVIWDPSFSPIDCIESNYLEKRQIKYFIEKMSDSYILYKELSFRYKEKVAKELLGI